jgi:hypothetical protein
MAAPASCRRGSPFFTARLSASLLLPVFFLRYRPNVETQLCASWAAAGGSKAMLTEAPFEWRYREVRINGFVTLTNYISPVAPARIRHKKSSSM